MALQFIHPNRNITFQIMNGEDWHWSVDFKKNQVAIHLPTAYPVSSQPEAFGGGSSRMCLQDPLEVVVYSASMYHWRQKIDYTQYIPKAGKFRSAEEFLRGAGAARAKRNKTAWRKATYAIREWRKRQKADMSKSPIPTKRNPV